MNESRRDRINLILDAIEDVVLGPRGWWIMMTVTAATLVFTLVFIGYQLGAER